MVVMKKMQKTSCKAHMKFIDVTALADAKEATNDNQSIGNLEILKSETNQADYGTFERNQFVLDGSKNVLPDTPNDVVFWSKEESEEDCFFQERPKITINFTTQHSSAGITLYFADDYPTELNITWYTLYGSKLDQKTFYPDRLVYACVHQVSNYGKIVIEFTRTRLPKKYIKLCYILYGRYIEWGGEVIKTAKVHEEINEISTTLSINTSSISILDAKNDFDISNENGAWKSVQKTQEVTFTETKDGVEIPVGTFFIDTSDFKSNTASFKLNDRIGLMDNYTFYLGKMYSNVLAGKLLEEVFSCASVTKYIIDEDVYNIRLSGYLAVQSCRAALQMICFACAAVADDSRSDIVRVFKPNRYVSSTIGTERKFNNKSNIKLDEYVSGVSVECGKYDLETETSEIFNDNLPKGKSKITFSEPCDPESLISSNGIFTEKRTNYVIVQMNTAGTCVITGKKYKKSTFQYTKNVDHISAGESENIKRIGTITLYNLEYLDTVAEKLLSYYALRKVLSMKYILNTESVSNWANIVDKNGNVATTLIEQQDIDLTGGFITTATCRGYSIVATEDVFAGTELYTGGDVLI